MIDRLVYSYWNPDGFSNTSGYEKFDDFLMSISLSLNVSRKHFKETVLVTNSFGKELLIDKLKLPFDIVSTEFDKYNHLHRMWWGWFKVLAYSLQDKPFIHIDNDAFFIDKPSSEVLNAKLCFQSIETPFEGGYGWYKHLLPVSSKAPRYPKVVLDNPVGYAFNCGIAGGNDLGIIKEWFDISSEFVLSEENQPYLQSNEFSIHQNLIHEQYFIASLTKSKKWLPNKEIKFLLRTNTIMQDCYRKDQRFTHFWGLTKKESNVVNRIENRMKNDYPETYNKIKNLDYGSF